MYIPSAVFWFIAGFIVGNFTLASIAILATKKKGDDTNVK